VLKVKLGTFCQFIVVHFDLISNIHLCRYASRTLKNEIFDMVLSYKSGRAGLGVKFVKIFRANFEPTYKNFCNIKSNDFFLS